MKYKTLFRLILKIIGVWIAIEAASTLATSLAYLLLFRFQAAYAQYSLSQLWVTYAPSLASVVVQLALAAYLFFGGRWIVDHAIPSNRPYCPECAYDLTHHTADRCPECGTPNPRPSPPPVPLTSTVRPPDDK